MEPFACGFLINEFSTHKRVEFQAYVPQVPTCHDRPLDRSPFQPLCLGRGHLTREEQRRGRFVVSRDQRVFQSMDNLAESVGTLIDLNTLVKGLDITGSKEVKGLNNAAMFP